jgi:hypothetical protein
MPQVTKLWTFDASAESWTLSSGSRITTDGYSGNGCLQASAAGRNATVNYTLTSPAISYQTAGVPASGRVTNVQLKLYRRVIASGAIDANTYQAGLDAGSNNLLGQQSEPASQAWGQKVGGVVGVTKQPADTFTVNITGTLDTGNDKAASIQILFDYIELIITYEVPLSVTVTAGSNGATTPGAGAYTRWTNETFSIEATPDTGYYLSDWLVNGSSYGSAPNPLELTITANTTIQPVFSALTQYTLTMSMAGTGTGSVSPTVGQHVYYNNESPTLTATPDTGNKFDKWVIDGNDDFNNPTTLPMTTNHTVVAWFSPDPDRYIIERQDNGGAFAQIQEITVASGLTTYQDTGPFQNGHTYGYRIKKRVDGQDGEWSDTATVNYATPPEATVTTGAFYPGNNFCVLTGHVVNNSGTNLHAYFDCEDEYGPWTEDAGIISDGDVWIEINPPSENQFMPFTWNLRVITQEGAGDTYQGTAGEELYVGGYLAPESAPTVSSPADGGSAQTDTLTIDYTVVDTGLTSESPTYAPYQTDVTIHYGIGNLNSTHNCGLKNAGSYQAIISGLPPGVYTYRVRVSNPDGYLETATRTFTLTSSSAPPAITITNYTKSKISDEAGHTTCTVTFQSDQALAEWEARADGNGHGSGLLVGSGGAANANTDVQFDVDYTELTQGDKVYRINVYGKNAGGEWTPYA